MISSQRLDAVCDISMGQAPSGDAYNYDGEGWPLIAGAGDFGDLYPDVKKYTTTAARLSNHGDIVLGIRASIGEKVMSDGEYCLGRGVAGLRAKPNLSTRYLWHWLTHAGPRLASKAKGATFKQVNKDDIGELEIALPSLPEQHRIAAILDQADALRAKRREALAQLDSLTQSIFIEMFGDPIKNPKGLPVVPLSECAETIQIGPFGTQLHEEDYIEGGIPLVNPTHIKGGKICPNMTLTVSELKYNELTNYYLNEGDLILGRRGEMGRCAVISSTEHGWLCGTGSLFVRPKKQVLHAIYLGLVVSSPSMRSHLESVARGVTMANLNKTIVGLLPIPMPQIAEQMKMVSILKSIETLKSVHYVALQELDRLIASLQHYAFRGEV